MRKMFTALLCAIALFASLGVSSSWSAPIAEDGPPRSKPAAQPDCGGAKACIVVSQGSQQELDQVQRARAQRSGSALTAPGLRGEVSQREDDCAHRWFIQNRRDACIVELYKFGIRRCGSSGCRLVGEGKFTIGNFRGAYMPKRLPRTYWITFADWVSGWGEARSVKMRTSYKCTKSCTKLWGGKQAAFGAAHQSFKDNMVTHTTMAVDKVVTTRASLTITLSKAGFTSARFIKDGVTMRCDRLRGIGSRGGCVYPSFLPTFVLSLSDSAVDESARHIRAAQRGLRGHPGRKADGTPLTRTTIEQEIVDNRNAAFAQCRREHVVGSCDEYPFATSRQGCAFRSCSVDGIDVTDNKTSGSRLINRFFKPQRVIHGDRYWVRIVS